MAKETKKERRKESEKEKSRGQGEYKGTGLQDGEMDTDSLAIEED